MLLEQGSLLANLHVCRCLNPKGMATDLLKTFGEKGEKKGPEITFTDNNGLMHTAQLLEEIYTNPDFPKGTSSLGGESLQQMGKSRADLWAYATLVSILRLSRKVRTSLM